MQATQVRLAEQRGVGLVQLPSLRQPTQVNETGSQMGVVPVQAPGHAATVNRAYPVPTRLVVVV